MGDADAAGWRELERSRAWVNSSPPTSSRPRAALSRSRGDLLRGHGAAIQFPQVDERCNRLAHALLGLACGS